MARFQPNPHREEAMQALREGIDKAEVVRRFGITLRTTDRYVNEIEHPKPPPAPKVDTIPKTEPRSAAPKPVTGPAQLATVAAKAPSPIIFVMGEQKIDLNPHFLYESFQYFEDIRRIDPEVEADFSLAILVSLKHAWNHLSRKEAVRAGVLIAEGEAS